MCTLARFAVERYETLGPDLATAYFVVERNGAVKFEGSDRWLSMKFNHSLLPTVPSRDIRLEAVDMSDTELMYISLDNFSKWSFQSVQCKIALSYICGMQKGDSLPLIAITDI